MRLAQAARDLSITTDDIVAFLAKKDIVVEKDSNTKLNEESVQLLFDKFSTVEEQKRKKEKVHSDALEKSQNQAGAESATGQITPEESHAPEKEEKDKAKASLENTPLEEQENSEKKLTETESPVDTKQPSPREEKDTAPLEDDEQKTPVEKNTKSDHVKATEKRYRTVADLLESENDLSDDYIIKAPKVSLQGLNVLGKIDLPEPKPKASKEEKETGKNKRKSAKTAGPRKRSEDRSKRKRKELTPQEIREREEKREQRKLEAEKRRAKKSKERYYKEKVLKPKQEQQKKQKPKKAPTTEPAAKKKEKERKPTTLLGKFWRWLNT